MKKKTRLLLLVTLCLAVSLCGCRKKVAETESETETMSETQSETETESESETESETETEKKTSVSKNTKSTEKSTEKTTVKPSTVNSNSASGSSSSGNSSSAGTTATQMCPYCYQQISTASNGDGTTVYSVHVAQEKAWADTYGYGTDNTQTTEGQNQTTTDDTAQCPYCYQWFTVSDGSYNAHITSEAGTPVDTGSDDQYVQCPKCGNVYPAGNAYDTHVCPANQ